MSQVIWSREALIDLERLIKFQEQISKSVARKARFAMLKAITLLEQNPEMGIVKTENPKTLELYAPFGDSAFVIRYRYIKNSNTVIVRVWHGKESR